MEPRELFESVDDQNRTGREMGNVDRARWQCTLALFQHNRYDQLVCMFQCIDQDVNQRRLAASMRADDLTDPILLFESLDESRRSRAVRKVIRNCSRLRAARRKRVGGNGTLDLRGT